MKSQTKQSVIWGGLLIIVGLALLVETFADLNAWVWVSILAAAGLVIFIIYLLDRSATGLLLTTYVLWAVAGLITLITLNILRDEFVAMYVLTAIAIPFLVTFLRNRALWWALIPTYILLVVGLMIGLIGADVLDDLLVPAYILLAVAVPFLAVFIRNTRQWWALIVGGILTVVGLSFLVAEAAVEYVVAAALVIAGIVILVRQFTSRESEQSDTTSESNAEHQSPG